MYRSGTPAYEHHRATFGAHDRFGYKDFIPDFTGTAFDPDEWASLFRRAGAQFVVPVAEHHDGFVMFDTGLSRWNAARMGPRRDVVKELSDAVRAQSMVAGASTHRAEHWWFFNGGMKFDSDVRDPAYADLYGPAQREELRPQHRVSGGLAGPHGRDRPAQPVSARLVRLVDRTGRLQAVARTVRRVVLQLGCREPAAGRDQLQVRRLRPGSAVYDVERGQQADARPMLWQNDTSVAVASWGWIEGQQYKDIRVILGDLMDVVSKNGALLLNVGPRPDGSFEPEEVDLLHRIGDWLGTNGEAVYGSTPWTVSGEGPTAVDDSFLSDEHRVDFTAADLRFTRRGDIIYAAALRWPADGELLIRSLVGDPEIARVELLGSPDPLPLRQLPHGLAVTLPPAGPDSTLPVLRITPAVRDPAARRLEVRN